MAAAAVAARAAAEAAAAVVAARAAAVVPVSAAQWVSKAGPALWVSVAGPALDVFMYTADAHFLDAASAAVAVVAEAVGAAELAGYGRPPGAG